MKKALILCFHVDCEDYDLDTLEYSSSDVLYGLAKDGVEKGNADIYTLDEFCDDINHGQDCLSNYYTFPIYVDTLEYMGWKK
jgi:hypothetical protein